MLIVEHCSFWIAEHCSFLNIVVPCVASRCLSWSRCYEVSDRFLSNAYSCVCVCFAKSSFSSFRLEFWLSHVVLKSVDQGCRKCGNREGAFQEIVHARGKLIICIVSQVKSNNTPGIARKLQNRLYESPALGHGSPIPGLVTQQLPLPNNSGLIGLMQSLVACRVANLAFLKPNFEIQAFLTHLAFFENQKYQSKSVFFF